MASFPLRTSRMQAMSKQSHFLEHKRAQSVTSDKRLNKFGKTGNLVGITPVEDEAFLVGFERHCGWIGRLVNGRADLDRTKDGK